MADIIHMTELMSNSFFLFYLYLFAFFFSESGWQGRINEILLNIFLVVQSPCDVKFHCDLPVHGNKTLNPVIVFSFELMSVVANWSLLLLFVIMTEALVASVWHNTRDNSAEDQPVKATTFSAVLASTALAVIWPTNALLVGLCQIYTSFLGSSDFEMILLIFFFSMVGCFNLSNKHLTPV